RLTVYRDDHVTGFDSGLCGRAVRLRLVNQRAADLLEAHRVRDLRGHRLDLHAEPAPGDMTIVLELRDHALRGRGWDIEADSDRASGRRKNRGVDAQHVAVGVERRAAGIAAVDRGIDLDVVLSAATDVAPGGRDDAGRHGPAQTERIADRNRPFANPRRMIRELHIREVAALDLNERKIALLVGADDLGGMGLAVVGRDRDGIGMVDHVIIGHRISVRADEEAGALADHGPGLRPAELELLAELLVPAELLEELLHRRPWPERIAILVGTILRLHLHAHRDNRGFTLVTRSEKP